MKRTRHIGFTLIELLVVIAIIAILAAILFPVFARAKEAALVTRAIAQMRQLSMGVMMYANDYDDYFVPCSLRTTDPSVDPILWPSLTNPYVKNEQLFVAPGSDGTFASNWANRRNQSIGYNEATSYDPLGCVQGAGGPGCEGFTSAANFSQADESSRVALFATTPNKTTGNYRGYTFNPYNGPTHPSDPLKGLPLISDRDLIVELTALTPAQLKPIYCRYQRTGKDDGRSPMIFADGHTKTYSAAHMNSFESGVIFRFR
ncbi:MAG: prepilin-type N-terminal cleavage/methylation domain-containing protein [Fimbriimonadaceae bacterium]|nr:prepilin-type N-terminal cleavage/methylation domain-containing protein [Fimbriimonadaceae bacterium]